jgi:hypothetical protein
LAGLEALRQAGSPWRTLPDILAMTVALAIFRPRDVVCLDADKREVGTSKDAAADLRKLGKVTINAQRANIGACSHGCEDNCFYF